MNAKNLTKLTLVALVAAAGLIATGCASTASGTNDGGQKVRVDDKGHIRY